MACVVTAGKTPEPRLAPPGAGVSALQRFVGKHVILPYFRARLSWERALDLNERQADRLLDLARGAGEELLARRVLVRPQIGLEDSSRFYSYAMVLEHLTIIGEQIAGVIVELSRGRTPPGELRPENLKPGGGMTAERSMSDYRSMVERFRRRIVEDVRDRNSATRFVHPWFGPLTAHAWLSFTPFHQTIHIKQARRILR